MNYEAIAKTWDRLAKNHDETAEMLSQKVGSTELDQQNALFAQTERIQAEQCRVIAQGVRDHDKSNHANTAGHSPTASPLELGR